MGTTTAVRTGSWIYNPALDLVVGCGAWSLPLLFLAYPFASDRSTGWAVAFYALALLFNYPHYMATIYRAYHTKEDFFRYRAFTQHLTAILIVFFVAAHWSYTLVPWLFTIYVTWSPWHYMSQNFGLMMMFIHRNGVHIDRKDRDALWLAFVVSYLMIFLTFHANESADPLVLSLGLPAVIEILRIPFLFVFLIVGGYAIAKLVRQTGWKPMTAPIVLFVTEFLWFVFPTVIELILDVRIPQTRYSAGILAVMHSAQYIWITSYYAKQESSATGVAWRWKAYFAMLVVGGIILFVPIPWVATYALGRDFTSSFLIVTALINIHHFILDGAVWKLREKRVASLLIEKVAPARTREDAQLRLSTLKIGAVAVLLLIVGLDQVRNYLASRSDFGGIAWAAKLNPYDAALQTRLGVLQGRQGLYDEARQSFERALRSRPNYEPARTYLNDMNASR